MKLNALAPFALVASMATPTTALAQDNSRAVTEHTYRSLQAYARSPQYDAFQETIINRGLYYLESRLQTAVFMNAIKSGDFDDNFAAKVNLTTCAGYAMQGLAIAINVPPQNPFFSMTFNTIDGMDNATQGAARNVDCRNVFYTYNLG